jgi:hypothetical protein
MTWQYRTARFLGAVGKVAKAIAITLCVAGLLFALGGMVYSAFTDPDDAFRAMCCVGAAAGVFVIVGSLNWWMKKNWNHPLPPTAKL